MYSSNFKDDNAKKVYKSLFNGDLEEDSKKSVKKLYKEYNRNNKKYLREIQYKRARTRTRISFSVYLWPNEFYEFISIFLLGTKKIERLSHRQLSKLIYIKIYTAEESELEKLRLECNKIAKMRGHLLLQEVPYFIQEVPYFIQEVPYFRNYGPFRFVNKIASLSIVRHSDNMHRVNNELIKHFMNL